MPDYGMVRLQEPQPFLEISAHDAGIFLQAFVIYHFQYLQPDGTGYWIAPNVLKYSMLL